MASKVNNKITGNVNYQWITGNEIALATIGTKNSISNTSIFTSADSVRALALRLWIYIHPPVDHTGQLYIMVFLVGYVAYSASHVSL